MLLVTLAVPQPRLARTVQNSGKIKLTSARNVKVGAKKRTLKLGARTFTAASNGKVTVKFRLSRSNLKALKRVKSLRCKVNVTLGGRTFTASVTLKAPRR